MEGFKVFIVVLAAITAVQAVCDRNAVLTCMNLLENIKPVEGSSPDMKVLCSTYTEVETCLAPLKESCEGDPSWSTVQPMQTSYSGMCGGSSGTGGSGGTGSVGCTRSALFSCLSSLNKNVDLVEFKGYPDEDMINGLCQSAPTFLQCAQSLIDSCASLAESQAKEISANLNQVKKLIGLFCNEQKPGFLKYAKECSSKDGYASGEMACIKSVPMDSNNKTVAETNQQECARHTSNMQCSVELTKELCSDESYKFVQEMQDALSSIMKPDCPTSGSIRLNGPWWIYLAILAAAIFFR